MTATLERDENTGRQWLTFDVRPSEATITALKAAGWRWSGYRKAWHHPSKFARLPDGVVATDGGFVTYSSERADRLAGRATKAREVSAAALERADAVLGRIPLGQPILVGHHSERRHRRDLARAHDALQRGYDAARDAREFEARAQASTRQQEARREAGAISRRLERLRKDLARVLAPRPSWARPPEGAVEDVHPEAARRAEVLRTEIARAERDLSDVGGVPADRLEVKPGDVVRIKGHVARVVKVNRKTLSCDVGMPWPLKYDRSWLEEVLTAAGDGLGAGSGSRGRGREDG